MLISNTKYACNFRLTQFSITKISYLAISLSEELKIYG